ncbi:MAG: EAL domain-containing protein, partial [Burkholderiales bacterium]|nr:EAL domain-containing protein [Burkholderiales bacterium]
SVNVASRQFREPHFARGVARIFADTRVLPTAIELEITESLLLENNEETRRTLDLIKVLGATLAIDDFGTGYSSLSYLKRFPLDRVKIDQSFVRDLGTDPDDLAIVRAIVALSRSLKLEVIAEGVETKEQLALLRSEGCDEYQGYLFARPMDADSVSRLLENSVALVKRFSAA